MVLTISAAARLIGVGCDQGECKRRQKAPGEHPDRESGKKPPHTNVET
jgi:hypothetical protein